MEPNPQIDQNGYWSEIKLDIIKEYATAYSKILSARTNPPFAHVYIEGFAGAGLHLSSRTKGLVAGSPLNALQVEPPFHAFHLIDIQEDRVQMLKRLIGERKDVFFYHGDCNEILLNKVFPKVRWDNYERGLCVLDPYGLNLRWEVLEAAGKAKTFDIFVNFPVMGMNRNALRRDPENVASSQKAKMTAVWGDESWMDIAYDEDMFGNPDKRSSDVIVEAFRKRLKEVAGFERVPKPIPMRNSKGGVIYYLYFASQKDTAEKIVLHIFKKYQNQGARQWHLVPPSNGLTQPGIPSVVAQKSAPAASTATLKRLPSASAASKAILMNRVSISASFPKKSANRCAGALPKLFLSIP